MMQEPTIREFVAAAAEVLGNQVDGGSYADDDGVIYYDLAALARLVYRAGGTLPEEYAALKPTH